MAELTPPEAMDGPWALAASRRYCETLIAQDRVGALAPWPLHPDLVPVFAFCRIADDITDEACFEGRRARLLCEWEDELTACYHGEARHPVFVALLDVARRHELPVALLQSFLHGCRLDLATREYPTHSARLRDCAHAANAVGRIVLHVYGHADPRLHAFADALSTAMRLVAALERLAFDARRGVCLIPQEDLVCFGVAREELAAPRPSREVTELLQFEVARVRALLVRGRPLLRRVGAELEARLLGAIERAEARLQQIEGQR